MIEPQMSVVVPVYSVEKEYFEECILSLKQQTLEAIEIIIVADGVKKEILDLHLLLTLKKQLKILKKCHNQHMKK